MQQPMQNPEDISNPTIALDMISQKEEAGIQLTQEEFDFMADASAYEEIERVKANFEVHHFENCYDNDIFNMFIQEEQYTELLEPIPKPHQVPQNDSNVIYEVFSMEQGGRTVEQHPETVEETRAYHESLFHNLAAEVEKINSYVNGMKSRKKNQSANVSKSANQKKHKANVKKLKTLISKDRLASSRPSKPRSFLRWLPTGRNFDLCGEITSSSNTKIKPEKRDAAHLQQHMQIAQKGEARIQITQEEFDFMAVAGACEETKRVTVNFTSEDTWQQASISSTQSDNAPDDKGNSICQEKYTSDLLKKYEISDISSVKTPMVPPNNFGLDLFVESRFTTSCSIDKDEYMMKAQVHVSRSSAISDVQALPQKENIIDKISKQ
nr:retrovirus-related Pol polyprotein from transposon TNT 1-94 [Tanacetum cinerariifolium]